MASSPPAFTIAIIGGGIAGVTLTIALLHRNINVHLYERYSGFEEIGAGIGFRGNAVRAMSVCDPKLKDAFDRVKTDAGIRGQETVWFNWYDGFRRDGESGNGREKRYMFTLRGPEGGGGCHRAHFLDEAVKLVPEQVRCFGKYLDGVEEDEEGLVLRFRDGSEARADAGEFVPT